MEAYIQNRITDAVINGMRLQQAANKMHRLAARVLVPFAVDPGAPPPAVDGVALAPGDRLLLTGQPNPVDNGVWALHKGRLRRPYDMRPRSKIMRGTFVFVSEGAGCGDYRLAETVGRVGVGAQRWERHTESFPLAPAPAPAVLPLVAALPVPPPSAPPALVAFAAVAAGLSDQAGAPHAPLTITVTEPSRHVRVQWAPPDIAAGAACSGAPGSRGAVVLAAPGVYVVQLTASFAATETVPASAYVDARVTTPAGELVRSFVVASYHRSVGRLATAGGSFPVTCPVAGCSLEVFARKSAGESPLAFAAGSTSVVVSGPAGHRVQ